MKIARITLFVAALAFIAGFWAACSIGFDETDPANQFACTVDQDCISPYRCLGGICKRQDGGLCVDADGDGFGEGEEALRLDCPKCESEGRCEEDCNDNDPAIAPDLLDTCDGKDNDCDGEVDEPLECESGIDCPAEDVYIPSCTNMMCQYKTPISVGNPACVDPVACVDGEREERPDECF